MNKLKPQKFFLGSLLSLSGLVYSQEHQPEINISQEETISKLQQIKINLQESHKIEDRFVIQLFSGKNGEASEKIADFEKFYDFSARIKYEAPNYKVWVGNFRNRLEADRALLMMKDHYPSAFIPKPKRR